jgi:hypothetical protein
VETFDTAFAQVMECRDALAAVARRRAVEHFAFDVIFPRYLDAAATGVRRPLPGVTARMRTLARLRPPIGVVTRWAASRIVPPRREPAP